MASTGSRRARAGEALQLGTQCRRDACDLRSSHALAEAGEREPNHVSCGRPARRECSLMSKNDRIFVAGHRGMVGSAIMRKLQNHGYTNIVTRARGELDLV